MTEPIDVSLESPCIGVCMLDETSPAHCIGCGRTLADIAGWPSASDDDKLRIIADAKLRMSANAGR